MPDQLDETREWLATELRPRIPRRSKRRTKDDRISVWRYDDFLCCVHCHKKATDHDFQIGALLTHRQYGAILCRACVDAGHDPNRARYDGEE